jgi:hypothetical protein
MIHDLKTWPESFEAIELGIKTHEVRFNDRDYQVGDLLRLKQWDPAAAIYCGREVYVRIDYIGDLGIYDNALAGYVGMSIKKINK